jgi:hypothetical protein
VIPPTEPIEGSFLATECTSSAFEFRFLLKGYLPPWGPGKLVAIP